MKFQELNILGCYLVENFLAKDIRGQFVKTYNNELFRTLGFDNTFKESYYSQSWKNVIRGMHFQIPPYDHEKLVYVTEGEILDVILDLRTLSETYKSFVSIKLTAFQNSIFIPKGCAHGFLSLTDSSTVVYNVSSIYNAEFDTGIRWDSFGCEWGKIEPIISNRDKSFISLEEFKSPF